MYDSSSTILSDIAIAILAVVFNPLFLLLLLLWYLHRRGKQKAKNEALNPSINQQTQPIDQSDGFVADRLVELARSASTESDREVLQRAADSVRAGLHYLITKTAASKLTSETTQRPVVAQNHPGDLPKTRVAPVKPTEPVIPLAERGLKALQNINILLYLGAFFIVVAAGIFVGSTYGQLSDQIKIVFLAAFALTFYGSGLALYRFTSKIKPAGVTFTAIGLLLGPLVGLAAQNLLYAGQNAGPVWLVTTAILIPFQLLAYYQIKQAYIAYFSALTTVSLFQSLTATLNAPVYWYGWAMLGTSLAYVGLAKIVKDDILAKTLDISAQIFVPLAAVLALIGYQTFGLWSVGIHLVLTSTFYFVCSALRNFDESKEEVLYLSLAATLFPLGLSLVMGARQVPDLAIRLILISVAAGYVAAEVLVPEEKHRPVFGNLATLIVILTSIVLIESSFQLAWYVSFSMLFHLVHFSLKRKNSYYSIALLTGLTVPGLVGNYIFHPSLGLELIGTAYLVSGTGAAILSQYFIRPRRPALAVQQDGLAIVMLIFGVLAVTASNLVGWLAISYIWSGAVLLFMAISESPFLVVGSTLVWAMAAFSVGNRFGLSAVTVGYLHLVLAVGWYLVKRYIPVFNKLPLLMAVCYGAGFAVAYLLGFGHSYAGVILMACVTACVAALSWFEEESRIAIAAAVAGSYGVLITLGVLQNWYIPAILIIWSSLLYGLAYLISPTNIRTRLIRQMSLVGAFIAVIGTYGSDRDSHQWVGVAAWFIAGGLSMSESFVIQNRRAKYASSAVLWLSTLNFYSIIDVQFSQVYVQTTAIYFGLLAYLQYLRKNKPVQDQLTLVALGIATIPLGVQALSDQIGGYVLGIFGLGGLVLLAGMSWHYRLVRDWGIGTLIVIALYKTAGYIFGLPPFVLFALFGVAALVGAIYLLSRRPHDPNPNSK